MLGCRLFLEIVFGIEVKGQIGATFQMKKCASFIF